MKSILKGFTVEQSTLDPVESTTLANHHSLVFNWADPIDVQLSSDIGWTDSICDKGALACLSPAENPSTLRWSQPFNTLGIYIDPAFVNEVLETKNFTFTQQFNLSDPFLLDIATKLSSVCTGEVFAEKLYAESLGVACIEHLAKRYCGSKDPYFPKGKLNPYQLKDVIDFAHSYMQFNIGLHEMAGLVHLSPYHFGRLFKQTVGKSPYQFILQLKIDCAKRLIKQKNGPISDIAYQLNFSDQSHFSNAFRKAVGVSPRQFLLA
jgi:AraC family transcriptional regulator